MYGTVPLFIVEMYSFVKITIVYLDLYIQTNEQTKGNVVWKHLGPWLVLVINDNVILYVTNMFCRDNGKLGRITESCTTTVKTILEMRTWSYGWNDESKDEGLRIPSVKELRTLGIELGLLFYFSRTIKRGCRWVVWSREF
jgi:hypothetical protein